jgi:hypothetical protein
MGKRRKKGKEQKACARFNQNADYFYEGETQK